MATKKSGKKTTRVSEAKALVNKTGKVLFTPTPQFTYGSIFNTLKPGTKLDGIRMENFTLESVDDENGDEYAKTVVGVSFKGGVFRNGVFGALLFAKCDFSGCTFEDIEFESTDFESCDFGGTTFKNCTSGGLSYKNCKFAFAHYLNLDLGSFELRPYVDDIPAVASYRDCTDSGNHSAPYLEKFDPTQTSRPDFTGSQWDVTKKLPKIPESELTDSDLILSPDKKWVYGFRTQVSRHTTGISYQVGKEYRLVAFDSDGDVDCSTGLYFAGHIWIMHNYSEGPHVVVRSLRTDMIQCGDKWRTRCFQVVDLKSPDSPNDLANVRTKIETGVYDKMKIIPFNSPKKAAKAVKKTVKKPVKKPAKKAIRRTR